MTQSPLHMSGHEWADYLKEGMIDAEVEMFRNHTARATPLGDESFLKRIGAL